MSHAIRPERPGDEAAITQVNDAAFGQTDESRMIDAVRRAGHPMISLVALEGTAIVGHILFTPVTLHPTAARLAVMGLAPMAVLPAMQRRGIGSTLVEQGLAECARAGSQALVVLGHPGFYPRFGFRPASAYGLRCEYDVPDEVFMAMELTPGALTGAGGVVRYLPEFA